ncbi:MAG: hypothetical protein CMJ65_05495 [Planctomycetaceae bacterium]|nr:hypothetical protein [Planctomycetaceae bacterium]MDP7275868.1 hypothetical protein [Planctomycetaceae bacterium]
MKRLRNLGAAAAVLAIAVLALQYGTVSAQKKGKTRSATTKQLMGGLVAAQCGALSKALKAKDIKKATIAAALLNESGHILMADGRCPSGDWAKGAKTLQGCSVVVLAKLKAGDVAGASGAFKALTGGCATCHKAHKGK